MVVLGVGMGMLMQTTMLVIQNSVQQRDLGAASGAATLFRTLGGSLGVSLLGTLFTQRLTEGLRSTAAGPTTPGLSASSQLTPAMLGRLPAPIRAAFQHAIVSGIQQVFIWAAAIAALAIIAALIIKEVPLRGDAAHEPPASPGTAQAPRDEQGANLMTTQQWHPDLAEGRPVAPPTQFPSATGDLARRAVQRFMWADVRRRSHERTAGTWQRAGVILGAAAAAAASLAAVAYVASWGWAAIALSIVVALLVPLTAVLRCAERAAEHRQASAAFTATAATFEHYLQRGLTPSTHGDAPAHVERLTGDLDRLENTLQQNDWGRLPRTTPRRRDIADTAAYGEYLLGGVLGANIPLPPPAAWV